MKEIYVIKQFARSYIATSFEEIQKMVDDGVTLVTVDITTSNPDVVIHLFEERLFDFFGIPEDAANKLVEDYFNYISSITGFDTPEINW